MTTEKIPARFRKTKTEKWAVMAPVADLEKALAEGGKVDVLKKSGDWSTFHIASLGRPFDVDGVEMCYGYGPEDEAEGDSQGRPQNQGQAQNQGRAERQSPPRRSSAPPPSPDDGEPLPEYQGSAEDEWSGF